MGTGSAQTQGENIPGPTGKARRIVVVPIHRDLRICPDILHASRLMSLQRGPAGHCLVIGPPRQEQPAEHDYGDHDPEDGHAPLSHGKARLNSLSFRRFATQPPVSGA